MEVGYTSLHHASRMSKDAAVLTEDQDALTTEKEYLDPHRTRQDKGKEG